MKKLFLLLVGIFTIATTLYAQQNNRNEHTNIRPPFERIPIYRLQLAIRTGVTHSAGTDSPVFVKLNDKSEKFYLVKAIDNFVEDDMNFYDILIDELKEIRDIHFIKLGVDGNDGVCFKEIHLYINNCRVYYKQLSNQKEGICIDNNNESLPDSLMISYLMLRGSHEWNYNSDRRLGIWLPSNIISKDWLISLIECSVGNQLYQEGGSIKWGTKGSTLTNNTLWGTGVETKVINPTTIHVDLDLEADKSYLPNPEVDVDMDIEFVCKNNKVSTNIKNIKITTDNVGRALEKLPSLVGKILGKVFGFGAKTAIKIIPGGGIVADDAGKYVQGYISGKFSNLCIFNLKFQPDFSTEMQGCKYIKFLEDESLQIRDRLL